MVAGCRWDGASCALKGASTVQEEALGRPRKRRLAPTLPRRRGRLGGAPRHRVRPRASAKRLTPESFLTLWGQSGALRGSAVHLGPEPLAPRQHPLDADPSKPLDHTRTRIMPWKPPHPTAFSASKPYSSAPASAGQRCIEKHRLARSRSKSVSRCAVRVGGSLPSTTGCVIRHCIRPKLIIVEKWPVERAHVSSFLGRRQF